MRGWRIGAFLVGFLAGALSIYYLLWRTGGLVPGHPLTLTTKELASGIQSTPLPLPTIPLPTPTAAVSAPVGLSPFPSPGLTATPAPLATPSLRKN